MDLRKSALVTGGAARVGRAICEGLAGAGYDIAVHYNRSSKDADILVANLQAKGINAVAVQADLSDSAQTRTLVEKAVAGIGPLGILVNNASLFEEDSVAVEDDALWDRHFNVHVKAPALLSSGFADQLPAEEGGLIVNMIDERVWKLTPNFTSYTLSKSALWTATRTTAQALAPRIRVNAIGPGPTLPSKRQTQEIFDDQVRSLPLQRSPDLTAFAKTILYFADMPAVTGQMIALDGGQHLGWETPDQRGPE